MDFNNLFKKDLLEYLEKLYKNSSMVQIFIWFVFILTGAITFDIYRCHNVFVCTIIVICVFSASLLSKFVSKREQEEVKRKTKLYLNNAINNEINNLYIELEPLLDNLRENEREIFKRIFRENQKTYIPITFEEKIVISHVIARGFYRYMYIQDYWNVTEYIHVLRITPILYEVLNKYFNENPTNQI
ncbi:MAG: hypothetical protein K6C94_05650 [Candidatus Gastranaerophilales bacterium]|nr:hypothetical protein [Candidatus Gastranaerophilales bacterium]